MSVAAAVLVITDWCPVEFLCLHIKSKTTLYRATKGKKDSLLALVTSLLMASGPHSWQKGHILIYPHNLISHHCPLLLCYITAAMTKGNCSLSGLAINYVCDIILLKLKLNLFGGKKNSDTPQSRLNSISDFWKVKFHYIMSFIALLYMTQKPKETEKCVVTVCCPQCRAVCCMQSGPDHQQVMARSSLCGPVHLGFYDA